MISTNWLEIRYQIHLFLQQMILNRHSHRNIKYLSAFLGAMKRISVVIVVVLVVSCQEDNIPVGLYDYQIVRLLGGDSAKTWFRTQYIENGDLAPISSCQDSIYAVFRIHESTQAEDSAYFYEVIPRSDCSEADTLFFGVFAASSVANVFTDSLNFRDDAPTGFMILNSITSRFLSLSYQVSGSTINVSYESVQ